MNELSALEQRQYDLEIEASSAGLARGAKIITDAYEQGRASDTGVGKRLIFNAFEEAQEIIERIKATRGRGWLGKYRNLVRRVDTDVLAMLCLRQIVNACASPQEMILQEVFRKLGSAVETEALIKVLVQEKPWYVDKVDEQIKEECSKSAHHISRKFRTGAKDVGINYEPWTPDEKVNVAKLLLSELYELGLFCWDNESKSNTCWYIKPSGVLKDHLEEAIRACKAVIRYPVMLCPPRKWTSYNEGGYLSTELRAYSPMMHIRGMRKGDRHWVINHLAEGKAQEAKDASNKTQEVPYKINRKVLEIARKAFADPRGILGLPAHGPKPKPDFPFPDTWVKEKAPSEEIALFTEWKHKMKQWYTYERTRVGKKLGLLGKLNEMVKLQDEPQIYFPTFFDWRGRMYFRSTLNPQSTDCVKGCIDFAEPKRLGKEGLFWLKVQVANCCGYDKKDFHLRVQWVDEHWNEIQKFLDDPFGVEPPEEDTAFTLLQAGYALQEALAMQNPYEYCSSVPVALDATCSGLQHYSALLRDEVGGTYTNLHDSHTKDEKEDIYRQVATYAMDHLPDFTDDICIIDFWKEHGIPRAMAKRPVMTYVYGGTLRSNIDYVTDAFVESGYEPIEGYSIARLCIPVGKALRAGVENTVPKATEGMRYLKNLVSTSIAPLRWITPVGIPVINWVAKHNVKIVKIRSMGVRAVYFNQGTEEYDKYKARNGISPNFIHSLDSSHLVKVINAFDGNILPIHDSFGTHACDAGRLHDVLMDTFVDLYNDHDILELLQEFNEYEKEIPEVEFGALDIEDVRTSRFAFC